MNSVRKAIGLLIIVFLGMPTLFGIIWAVGVTKGAVSPEFLSDLPQQIIDEVPRLIEELFEEAQDEDVVADENTRAWIQAAAQVEMDPKDVIAEIGLLHWLQNELTATLQEFGEVLRGQERPRRITLDLRPLRAALSHEALELYFEEILQHLPPCNDEMLEHWQEAGEWDGDLFDLPACQPDLALWNRVFHAARLRAIEDIPDDVEVFEDVPLLPFGFSRTVVLFSYTLFLLPALFLFLGAVIAASSPSSLMRWLGVAILITGLLTLASAAFVKFVTLEAFDLASFKASWDWTTDLEELFVNKTGWIFRSVFSTLFSPVMSLSGVISVFGLLLFALSFIVRGETRVVTRTVSSSSEEKAKSDEKSQS